MSPEDRTQGWAEKFPWVDDGSMADGGLQRVVGVDWSGDQGPGQRRKIWAAVWTASTGKVLLESGRTRDELMEWLVEMARETPRMVVGFDFTFSYPAWFLRELGIASAPEFWRLVADGQGERWLHKDCEDGRFWGRRVRRGMGRNRRSFVERTLTGCCEGQRRC